MSTQDRSEPYGTYLLGSNGAENLVPLVHLVGFGTAPPEVIERSRKDHKANVLVVANQFNQESNIHWEGMLRRFRLLSLCAEAKNPLLWSHYADSHRGVALEFDASFTMEAPFGAAKPVKYCKRVPRLYSRKQFIESALNLNPISGDQRTFTAISNDEIAGMELRKGFDSSDPIRSSALAT